MRTHLVARAGVFGAGRRSPADADAAAFRRRARMTVRA